jgi:hypothetical protein
MLSSKNAKPEARRHIPRWPLAANFETIDVLWTSHLTSNSAEIWYTGFDKRAEYKKAQSIPNEMFLRFLTLLFMCTFAKVCQSSFW